MALYQQLRECRDAIANHPIKQKEERRQVILDTKSTQTGITLAKQSDVSMTDYSRASTSREALGARKKVMNNVVSPAPHDVLEEGRKRPQLTPPKQDKSQKRYRTAAVENTLEKKDDPKELDENTWKQVEHHKKTKKKAFNTKHIKEYGEALTIKTNDTKTYAEMLKQMKDSINPSELGVEINEMRRTQAGELLIKLKQGEGQAEKLKYALSHTLGEDVTIRCSTKNAIVDIRDMDESTEEQEIISALMENTGVQQTENFKILNIRESYGKTKQALVQMPSNIAARILTERRIKIGWIRCRIRKKEKSVKCFRCLDQGHIAPECKGTDRTNVCRRCCRTGHKSNSCEEEIRCILCEEAGINNIKHFIGSSLCVTNRRNHQRNNGQNTSN